MNRIHLYSVYQRIWHWTQALSVTMLLLSGLVIHNPHLFYMFNFQATVAVHNIFAALLLLNALAGMFYYFTTGEIKQLIPRARDFIRTTLSQVRYYTYGIFRGEPYPFHKAPEQRLNPLQRITYLLLLNILLPLQITSGVLIWGAQAWPGVVSRLGGLPLLAFVHSLGSWLFAAFLIMHIYLTTTGQTPLANLKAMVTGYEDVEETAQAEYGS